MSIIHEALKKVETGLFKPAKVSAPRAVPADPGAAAPRLKKPYPWRLSGLIAAALLLSAGGIWLLLQSTTGPRDRAAAAVTNQPLDYALMRALKNAYKLNGVFFSDGKGYALINNQIVAKGDLFEGMRVLGVFDDSVVLDKDGTYFMLNTRHN